MSEQNPEVAQVLTKIADSLDADRPDDEMTNAARIGQICQHTPGQANLFDEVFPATPGLSPRRTRGEYAAELRKIGAQG
jgi:hypothetical protein